jgi:hypothetical protein
MRGYFFYRVTIVDDRLEHLHLLTGNGGAAQTADQFIRFPAKHRSGDHFEGAMVVVHGQDFTTVKA